ncbi:hypothetical protein FRC04_007244 [Tulasnella sp. 424]|nr:hypothetical protein FRC04_007244 [Tulasnella sp. 424]KAG8976175.1 hypothetical protein FRC05_004424 [Tulasnella sp. 425]
MSTVQRLQIVFTNISVFLFTYIVSTCALLTLGIDVGFMDLKDIWSTFLRSSFPSPPPSSSPSTVLDSGRYYRGDSTALDNFKVPACAARLVLTLSACLYIRNIFGHQSFNDCIAQVRLSLLLQHNELLVNGLQKATEDVQKATADVKQEQAMSKFHREMVQGACRKFADLSSTSAEALRRSNKELDESKQNVIRLNTLVINLRQELEHSAKQHKRDIEAADRSRLKAIALARYAQAKANALRSEAASACLELDAMRIEIDLVRRDLGASKRRAKAARNEAWASRMENISLQGALAESRVEVSTVRKGAKNVLKTLKAELKEQKAKNRKGGSLVARRSQTMLQMKARRLRLMAEVCDDSSDTGDMPEHRLELDQTQRATVLDVAGSTSTRAPGLDQAVPEGRAPLPSTCSYMIA